MCIVVSMRVCNMLVRVNEGGDRSASAAILPFLKHQQDSHIR